MGTIFTDGEDNDSTGSFKGSRGFDELVGRMEGVPLRFNLFVIGNDVGIAEKRTYEHLAMATGGVFGMDNLSSDLSAEKLSPVQQFALPFLMPKTAREYLAQQAEKKYMSMLEDDKEMIPFPWHEARLAKLADVGVAQLYGAGSRVVIHGLTGAIQHNGKVATAKAWKT